MQAYYFYATQRRNPTKKLQITLHSNAVPQTKVVKYLELHPDSKLIWKQHICKKKKYNKFEAKEKEF